MPPEEEEEKEEENEEHEEENEEEPLIGGAAPLSRPLPEESAHHLHHAPQGLHHVELAALHEVLQFESATCNGLQRRTAFYPRNGRTHAACSVLLARHRARAEESPQRLLRHGSLLSRGGGQVVLRARCALLWPVGVIAGATAPLRDGEADDVSLAPPQNMVNAPRRVCQGGVPHRPPIEHQLTSERNHGRNR